MPEMVCNAAAIAYSARGSSKVGQISAHGSGYTNRPLIWDCHHYKEQLGPLTQREVAMRIGMLYDHDLARARYLQTSTWRQWAICWRLLCTLAFAFFSSHAPASYAGSLPLYEQAFAGFFAISPAWRIRRTIVAATCCI